MFMCYSSTQEVLLFMNLMVLGFDFWIEKGNQYFTNAGAWPFWCAIIPTAACWEKVVGFGMQRQAHLKAMSVASSSSLRPADSWPAHTSEGKERPRFRH